MSIAPAHPSSITRLPYDTELGSRLRDLSVTTSRPVWLRLAGGRQELFAQWPERVVRQQGACLEVLSGPSLSTTERPPHSLWTLLNQDFPLPCPATPSPFKGGWLGCIGYETGMVNVRRLPFPDVLLGDYRRFIFIDHDRRHAEMVTLQGYSGPLDDPTVTIEKCQPAHTQPPFALTAPFQPLTGRDRYHADVARIQAYLQAGDCYQVNYAQAFRARCRGASASAMERLLALSRAPHAAWMLAPEGEILCLSPELFLSVRDGKVVTRPIKGTAPRAPTPEADAKLRNDLAASPKNRAENVMIVDLLRHDLGRHAVTGSVIVDALFEVESLPQVHHLVSTISATMAPGASVLDVIRDSFPGGSITGAPKKRAMEIIAELEPTPRSVYCGSIGFIGANGDAELNIAIRTLLRLGDDLYAWAGGGIVADSEAEAEYQECFDKMGALMRALENPS